MIKDVDEEEDKIDVEDNDDVEANHGNDNDI